MSTEAPSPKSAPDRAGAAFHPPLLVVALLVVGYVGKRFIPLEFLPAGVSRVGGAVLVAGAVIVFVWAAFSLRRAQTSVRIQDPTTTVVTGGPYGFSRNPIYLSMMVFLLGLGVGNNSLWFPLLVPLGVIALNRGVILREEAYLERKFGHSYREYRQRVRRWI